MITTKSQIIIRTFFNPSDKINILNGNNYRALISLLCLLFHVAENNFFFLPYMDNEILFFYTTLFHQNLPILYADNSSL